MYRRLRAPPLRTRRQRGTRGRRTDRRRVHFRWILDSPKRCGFFPFSGLNDIVWIDLLSAVNIPYLNMVDMTDIIYSRIELNWNWIGNWNWIELEMELCDIGTVTGPEPGIRCDANPVASLRRRPWLVGAWLHGGRSQVPGWFKSPEIVCVIWMRTVNWIVQGTWIVVWLWLVLSAAQTLI